MTQATHTPGPWEINAFAAPNETRWQIICRAPNVDKAGNIVASSILKESDAPLIAAAPEMLAALRAIEKLPMVMLHLQRVIDDNGNHICGNIRAAIAKAVQS